ncbi:GTP pyrophosphokinase [Paenibacillus polymyxa]|uniref:GTP pyrophosphokinase n=1 Tax=Paenibacillus polymyxa TaxID=1406 RepID=UPI003B5AC8EB
MSDKNIDDAISWYIKMRPVYKNLANKVESIIREVLTNSGASYYTITSRAKEIESFTIKANKEKYKNPQQEIKDLAGIRVITYVKSEVNNCCELIKPLFELDHFHSVDKTKELGNDKVGYRSIHYVAKLTEDRLSLPEYQIFKDMGFEIQVRTILEHAWADISHDRNYKFNGVLPPDNDIERRFSLAAATLELVDREFDNLAREIVVYGHEVVDKVKKDELNIEINTTSLSNYLKLKFKPFIDREIIEPTFNNKSKEIIDELNAYGISNLSDLELIIKENTEKFVYERTNFLALLRDIMMLNNINLYFEKAWSNNWTGVQKNMVEYYISRGIDMSEIIDKYDLSEDDEEEEGYELLFDEEEAG